MNLGVGKEQSLVDNVGYVPQRKCGLTPITRAPEADERANSSESFKDMAGQVVQGNVMKNPTSRVGFLTFRTC